MKVLQSDFAESSLVQSPSGELPMIPGVGKFSYGQPILPRKPRDRTEMSEYRALSSIQYQSDIANDDLIDVRFPALSNRRESTNVVSG